MVGDLPRGAFQIITVGGQADACDREVNTRDV